MKKLIVSGLILLGIEPISSFAKNNIAVIGVNPVPFPRSIKQMDNQFQQIKNALSKLNAWYVSDEDFAIWTQKVFEYLEELKAFSQENGIDTSNILQVLKSHTEKLLDRQKQKQKLYSNQETKRFWLVHKSLATWVSSNFTFLFLVHAYRDHKLLQDFKSITNPNADQMEVLERLPHDITTSGLQGVSLLFLATCAAVATYLEYKTMKQDHDHRYRVLSNIDRQIKFALKKPTSLTKFYYL